MPDASSPQQFVDVLTTLARTAFEQGASEPGQIGQLIDKALQDAGDDAKKVERFPDDVKQRLHDLTHPPDWFSLAAFVLLQIAAIDKDRLSVGAVAATPDWAKALSLTYKKDPGDVAMAATLTLALFGEGKKGIHLETSDKIDIDFPPPRPSDAPPAPVGFGIHASGKVSWKVPLSGPVPLPELPLPADPLTLTVNASLGVIAQKMARPEGFELSTGPLFAAATLSSGEPLWSLSAGFGTPHHPGLHVGIDGEKLLGPIAAVISAKLPKESYSPSVHVSSSASPSFDLGHEGASL